MGGLAAVTGATGFVGRRLVATLIGRGWRVRALVRRAPQDDPWVGLEPDFVVGDLLDEAALGRLVAGVDVVIHGAGLIKARRRADFFAVNAAGAERTARISSGRPMILISSLAARSPELSDYAASKRAGEAAARDIAGRRLTIVRPPAIYGPGDQETLALFRLAGLSPVLPLPGPPDARLALAHVDDVAAAIADLAAAPPGVGPYAIPGARCEGYAWREILTVAAAAMSRRPRLIATPAWLIRLAGTLSGTAGALSGTAPIFAAGKAREILHRNWSVSLDEQAPGAAKARFSLEDGFADTVAWYRTRGWLP